MAKYVDTNVGLMPIEDYLETKAIQFGFDSYSDMKANGFDIVEPKTIEIEIEE